VSTTQTVLILHNVESVYFFYSNPVLCTYIRHTHTSAEPPDFDTRQALLLLVCVYFIVYFGSVFGFHLPTIISPSCNFRISGRTAHADQLTSAPSPATIDGRAVWRPMWSPWWLTQLGCDVLEPTTTSLSERLRCVQHPSAMSAVWINWTSLGNCCRHSQRWITVLTYILIFCLVQRFPDCAAGCITLLCVSFNYAYFAFKLLLNCYYR
jgi:hypothetical protein